MKEEKQNLKLVTLRLPVFSSNKPYIFFRTSKDSEKYRISLSPEFLDKFNLTFRIFRAGSLELLLKDNSNLIYNQFEELFLKLPDINKLKVQKTSVILDTDEDDNLECLKIDKYIFIEDNLEHTAVFISNRDYDNVKNYSIVFISNKYVKINDLLEYLRNI